VFEKEGEVCEYCSSVADDFETFGVKEIPIAGQDS
jgi:hypothetical protein